MRPGTRVLGDFGPGGRSGLYNMGPDDIGAVLLWREGKCQSDSFSEHFQRERVFEGISKENTVAEGAEKHLHLRCHIRKSDALGVETHKGLYKNSASRDRKAFGEYCGVSTIGNQHRVLDGVNKYLVAVARHIILLR